MDTKALIELILVIGSVILFIKFMVSPIIKAILGIISFIVIVYLLQKFLGFDIGEMLSPLGISLDFNNWSQNISWILKPAEYCLNQIKNLLNFISNLTK